jgi:hypothetical protein
MSAPAASTALAIGDLPFVERPLTALLDLEVDRDGINREYTGFGWAVADAIWLETGGGAAVRIDDALVIALHTADDAAALPDDLELEFDLPGRPLSVLASAFLERWLPELPQRSAIVLAICNPHRTLLRRPSAAAVPVHLALGNVEAWWEGSPGESCERILLAAEDWCTLCP